MKVIVGLGNPGIKYVHNRHNVGIMTVDSLQSTVHSKDLKILKSDKYMNDSGLFIKKLKAKYSKMQMPDLYIIHDDLDIPLGSFKIQFGKGPKVHNGINDIYEKIGTSEFWHVRVGVDNRKSDDRTAGKEYVLEDFTREEKKILNNTINKLCLDLIKKLKID